jgi:hypothetical protein
MVKYLAGGIDDLGRKVLVLISNHLAERVLDGGIVAVDKVAIDKLHRQTRLACAPCQCGTSHMLSSECVGHDLPTALLPTMAIFLCLGAGMLVLAFWGGRMVAERLARMYFVSSVVSVDRSNGRCLGWACSFAFSGSS